MCVDGWPSVANPSDNASDLRKQNLWLNGSCKQVGDQNPQDFAEKNMYIRESMFVRAPRRGKLVCAYDHDGRLTAPSYIRGLSDSEPCRHIAKFHELRS